MARATSDFRVRLDPVEVRRLGDDVEVERETYRVAGLVARDAQASAPRLSGEGADSIRPWPGRDALGPYSDVSWDRDHFYMSFHEDGAKHLPARHFLRDALDALGPYVHL